MMSIPPNIRLHEFDKQEWTDVYRIFRPSATLEQFEKDWQEFQAEKAARSKRLNTQ